MIRYLKKIKRSDFILLFVFFAISIILIRCVDLLYIENKAYINQIEKREIKSDIIKATRGTIVDRNGSILAESILTDTLGIKNTEIFFKKNKKEDIEKLCLILDKKY